MTLVFLTGCSEIKTTDPDEVYKYWSGSTAQTDLQLLKGEYWQSAHWTKEYVVFLKLKPTEKWWAEFVDQNQLQIDNGDRVKPTDTPSWFNPTNKSVMYNSVDDSDQGSRYFKDPLTGVVHIYEIQL